MSRFFIDHPVFAWVIAILISLAGVISIFNLGVESYPNVVPPQVNINASYPGASASTTEKTVTQVIEQQLTGIDHLLYFNSSSSSNGSSQITLTFETGTDPDIAQVQVQNKVALATPRLPSEVVQQGVVVAKANAGFLMVIALRSSNPAIDRQALNDLVGARVLDQISRVPGVGSTRQFGSEYAMNIWLDPDKLRGYGLTASQALAAVRGQNVQFAAGTIGGQPSMDSQGFLATVSAESRFSSPEEFEGIILRTDADGSSVRLRDVARVGLGAFNYGFDTRWNGKPTGAFAIQLLPGANALNVAKLVRAKLDELAPSFPEGVEWFSPYDSTTFVKNSINEVVKTLFEAFVLVFLVILIFLQNFRATIIPTLVIPVALLGTFFGMKAIGFTVNQLTLFGLVLAIGIVVDDAIVVIENVERIMREEKLPIKEATRKAMGQITGAVVAITVVLAAVFIPSALQGGTAGAIYQQFALTIAMAMVFSAFLALGFTPALCATVLKPTPPHAERNFVFRWFDTLFERVSHTYVGHTASAVRHAPRWMLLFVLIVGTAGFLFTRLPGSFLPEEDQGNTMAIVQLPSGATLQRTQAVMQQVLDTLLTDDAVEGMMGVAGFSFVGVGENVGMAFIRLKPWEERSTTAQQFIQRANKALGAIADAQIFVVNMPTVSGLGQFGGFDMYLQDRAGLGRDALADARNTLLGAAAKRPELTAVRPNTLADAPQIQLEVDRLQAASMGLSVSDIYTAIQLMLAPVYVNDFFHEGRVKRVTMQADRQFRMGLDALAHFYTRASGSAAAASGDMVPIANVVHGDWFSAPPVLTRYNGYSAIEIVGSQAPGRSSGEAMTAMQDIVTGELPAGFGYDWTGQSYQEILSGNAATLLLLLSIVVVFLCLAALYESWSIPVAVLLVVPLGILGALVAAWLRGLPNDIFFKIGLVTIIGLAAKNAILIVEFAVAEQQAGRSLREAILDAARMRFRPILMTSFAFILGVTPLAVSTGAGANARHAIGTGVIGGMLFATFLGVLLIPVFYVVVRRLLGDRLDHDASAATRGGRPG